MRARSSWDDGKWQCEHGAATTTAHGNAHRAATTTAHGNARTAAVVANGDATMADAPAAGDSDGAALVRALVAVKGGVRDGNAPPAADADHSNATVPCAGSSEWHRPWYSQ
jgi:hypothetical protein